MANTGDITSDDDIATSSDGPWRKAAEVTGLQLKADRQSRHSASPVSHLAASSSMAPDAGNVADWKNLMKSMSTKEGEDFMKALKGLYVALLTLPKWHVLCLSQGGGHVKPLLESLDKAWSKKHDVPDAGSDGFVFAFTSRSFAEDFTRRACLPGDKAGLRIVALAPRDVVGWITTNRGKPAGAGPQVVKGIWFNGGPEVGNSVESLMKIYSSLIKDKSIT